MARIDAERWRVLNSQLDHLLDLPEEERSPWLAAQCASDPSLAADLQSLLTQFQELARTGFLEQSLAGARDSVARPVADSPQPLAAPRYEIVSEHARGGMGRILRARDLHLDRVVAIKELLRPTDKSEARLLREIKLTARLEHPSIVPVHDAGRWQASDKLFYSMKLVSGRPLGDVVLGAASLRERLGLLPNLLAVMDAIAYAHAEHVIHRDLKPANILVGAYGETVVVDWGLAKEIDRAPGQSLAAADPSERTSLTGAGTVLGTPSFMPPEQARGMAVDYRADVYSLGALLYFVVCAAPPYDGRSPQQLLKQVLSGAPRALRERVPEAPADLCAIVDKAMARAPTDRYPSALELASDLRRFMTGQLVSARSYVWREVALRFIRKHRGVALLCVLFALTVLIATVWFAAREAELGSSALIGLTRRSIPSAEVLDDQT